MNDQRTLAVHCVDWPVTAAGFRPEDPVAIVRANRVEACSVAARGSGVTTGLRRREAQRRNPQLEIVDADPARDTAMFESIVNRVMTLAPLVEVFTPGTCLVPTLGPSRYYGGDHAFEQELSKVIREPAKKLGAIYQIGIADSPFAARLAARTSVIVQPGETPDFLAPFPLDVLDRPRLTSLLNRLGMQTLGEFAALDAQDVMARFGPDGATAHRLCSGLDAHLITPHPAPVDLVMVSELDPPADRIDIAAFTGRALAVQLLSELIKRHLMCERVTIEVETERGETLSRCWRFDGMCTERSLSERVRWQLEGWLSGAVGRERPTGAVTLLRLIPDAIRPNDGEQHDLWNIKTANDERAARGFSRLQALAGPDSVQVATVSDGRHPEEQTIFTAWGEHVDDEKRRYPWPNRLPRPAPSIIHRTKQPVDVRDETGASVTVSKRGTVTRRPTMLHLAQRRERIVAWAGPWTSDDQWWDPQNKKRRAFMQVVTESGSAHLLAASGGLWTLDATYD